MAPNRDHRLREPHTNDAQGNTAIRMTRICPVALEPAKAAAGTFPSFAPTWLPFEDVIPSNHTGQRTTTTVGAVS